MDIKFNIKGLNVIRGQIKVEDLDVGISCSEGEVLNSNECVIELLDKVPAVQGLIKKFTSEVNFAPAKPANHQPKTADTISELCKRIDALSASLKKEREANARIHQTEREIINSLNRRLAEAAERTQKF